MTNWSNNVRNLERCLSNLSVRDGTLNSLEPDEAFGEVSERVEAIRKSRRTLYLIGNGASASMASHISADLAKNAHVHTQVFSDLSLITAIANDMGYKNVFSEPLRRRMKPGDMLLAISSSGESPNILHAVHTAQELGGHVTTLSAMKRDNSLSRMGTINFYVPADTYGLAESCHAAILHHMVDLLAATARERPSIRRDAPIPIDRAMQDNQWINIG
ncbi:MAG: SIS domain-containing protein [Deltaproteobacteria bacterium]|nr:SIS domain-containing protein [Deltaproteobacteria bacterium]